MSVTQAHTAEIAQRWQQLSGNPGSAALVSAYYPNVTESDFEVYGPEVLAATLDYHFGVAQRFDGEAPQIDIHNPDAEAPDYTGNRTIIDIVVGDKRFLLSSIVNKISSLGYAIRAVHHPILRTVRTGGTLEVIDPAQLRQTTTDTSALPIISAELSEGGQSNPESWIHIEIDRIPEEEFGQLQETLASVVGMLGAATRDYPAMRDRAREIAEGLRANPPAEDLADEASEAAALLEWLDGRFAFMGYREYRLNEVDGQSVLEPIEATALGISAMRSATTSPLSEAVAAHALDRHVLVLTKANSRSHIIRPDYMDYLGVKTFDENGQIVGEKRFVGLYTTSMYTSSVLDIPVIRGKVRAIIERSGMSRESHSGDELLSVLESYPRDEILQSTIEDIEKVVLPVVNLQEKREASVFIRRDEYERFVSVLVYVPRDLYDTASRKRVERVLRQRYRAESVDFDVQLSSSALARLHFTARVARSEPLPAVDSAEVADRIRAAVRSWSEDVQEFLAPSGTRVSHSDQARVAQWGNAFPGAYEESYTPHEALTDIARFEECERLGSALMRFEPDSEYLREAGIDPDTLPDDAELTRVRMLFYKRKPASLSTMLPLLSSMGGDIIDERPFRLSLGDGTQRYLYDFGIEFPTPITQADFGRLEGAYLAGWMEEREYGNLDRLLLAGLNWREVEILRAIVRYLRQASVAYSDSYIARVLAANTDLARGLADLFAAKFDPDFAGDREAAVSELEERVEEGLRGLSTLDEDRIVRSMLAFIKAVVRTNFYHPTDGTLPTALAFKLLPDELSFLPLPRPQIETWVYSPRVEGVHLRFGAVARGGLRWSDRRDDFRTEALGLAKTQMVKNALIVPAGAKGGFYPKGLPVGDPETRAQLGQAAYEEFIGALLDITDNLDADGTAVSPERTVIYDSEDAYLVVAADKGTARFSDVANAISTARGFWLGDAFASGGSNGYDHKEMGITSRGAWKSTERHFRELGVNTDEDDFTVVGVGDMSGDVFGNGMLRTPHTRLVAAFDHRDIFIDPNPDAAASFQERKRLYDLPGSSWQDYSKELISAGGGVFSRSAKAITVSEEAAEALGIEQGSTSPDDLIRAVLRAPVDLLYFGGIGTYLKATEESDLDVGDKANDAIRINGEDVRARVVVEGGNLACTQRGRVEAARSGVRINTDAIDNSGGVDASDHEVNIKLLLEQAIAAGALAREDRSGLLRSLQNDVAQSVLAHNYAQNAALGDAAWNARAMTQTHVRLMGYLEEHAGLDREVEALPTDAELTERHEAGGGITTPETAVLLAYVKMDAGSQIYNSAVPDEAFMRRYLESYFPASLAEQFSEVLASHPLAREIAVSNLVNRIVDFGGISYLYRLLEETGTSVAHAARVYTVVNELFSLEAHLDDIRTLDNRVSVDVQKRLQYNAVRLLDRASRWLIQQAPGEFDVLSALEYYQATVAQLRDLMPSVLQGKDLSDYEANKQAYIDEGVPEDVAARAAGMLDEFSLLDIVQIASRVDRPALDVAAVYYGMSARFQAASLLKMIGRLDRSSRWKALARAATRDEFYQALHGIVVSVFDVSHTTAPTLEDRAAERMEQWEYTNRTTMEQVVELIDEISRIDDPGQAPISVLLRMLRSVVRSTEFQSEVR